MLLAFTCSCSPVQRFLLIGCFKPRDDGPAREITKCIKFANWVKIPTVRNICTFVILFWSEVSRSFILLLMCFWRTGFVLFCYQKDLQARWELFLYSNAAYLLVLISWYLISSIAIKPHMCHSVEYQSEFECEITGSIQSSSPLYCFVICYANLQSWKISINISWSTGKHWTHTLASLFMCKTPLCILEQTFWAQTENS